MTPNEHELQALRRKIEQGLPLDDRECQLLESELERTPPESHWVRELPEEEPSLAWRSSLNSKLGTMAKAQRRRMFWRYGSLAATACACAVAVVVVVQMSLAPPNGAAQAGSLEEYLVQSHQHLADTVGMDATSVPEPLLWNASM